MAAIDLPPRVRSGAMSAALWSAVVLLVALGTGTAILRGLFPSDLATRGEPFRLQLLQSLDRDDPNPLQTAEAFRYFDSRYAAHPLVTLAHVVFGGLFLTLAPVQFSARVRRRHLTFHRWSGRVLMSIAFFTTASGLYFGLFMPFGGFAESAAVALFAALFLLSLGQAFLAVRRGDVVLHREWMIRAFAIAIGISMVRIAGAIFDVALTPSGFRAEQVFVVSVWTGWVMTAAAAEMWIRYTRQTPAM